MGSAKKEPLPFVWPLGGLHEHKSTGEALGVFKISSAISDKVLGYIPNSQPETLLLFAGTKITERHVALVEHEGVCGTLGVHPAVALLGQELSAGTAIANFRFLPLHAAKHVSSRKLFMNLPWCGFTLKEKGCPPRLCPPALLPSAASRLLPSVAGTAVGAAVDAFRQPLPHPSSQLRWWRAACG